VSTGNDNNKVVDLQQRQVNQSQQFDRVGDLIKQCRGLTQKRLALLVGLLFDSVDDALFDLAEKAENNNIQTRYFDGMREVRKKRQLVERLFQEQLTREFAQFGPALARPVEELSAAQPSGLALVEDKDLEESLAVSAMVGKATNRLSQHLYAIEQRMSVLAGGNKVDSQNNPLGPRALCQSFQSTMVELEIELNVKLLILKLFDKHVMGGLDQLYEEVNHHLMQAGVLPQIKYPVASARRPPAPAGRSGASADAPEAQEYDTRSSSNVYSPAAVAEAELQIELYNTVRSLLSLRRGITPGPHAGLQQGPAFATNDLVSALSVLQSQAMSMPTQANLGPMMQLVPTGQIKEELAHQLHRLGSGDGKHAMAAVDEDTIDLVGMLFEFILQDRNLPAEMQALLARLQIPYLKCAILEKEMFAQKEHAARLLLDELAHAGLSWSEESDKDGRFYEKVKSVVEALLKDFSDDVQIFNRLLKDFRDFVGSSRKRAEVAELRAAEAARGRERLQGARKTAAREILSRIEGQKLPEVIRHILTRPWANVLVLTILRQGEGSHPWKTSLRVADELVWAAQPKATDSERARLRALMPELEKALRQGLAMVAYHDNDVRQLLSDLGAFYETQLDPAVKAPVSTSIGENAGSTGGEDNLAAPAPGDAPAADENFVDELARHPESSEAETDPEAEIQDGYYDIARAIKVGTWVEFRHADGRAERAKLSWISPISSKYLFVNRKGLKVADKTLLALAAELRHSRAMLLEDVPLFDRALDAIVERLKSSVGQTGTDYGGAAAPAGDKAAE
jgi:hypothetical protein